MIISHLLRLEIKESVFRIYIINRFLLFTHLSLHFLQKSLYLLFYMHFFAINDNHVTCIEYLFMLTNR